MKKMVCSHQRSLRANATRSVRYTLKKRSLHPHSSAKVHDRSLTKFVQPMRSNIVLYGALGDPRHRQPVHYQKRPSQTQLQVHSLINNTKFVLSLVIEFDTILQPVKDPLDNLNTKTKDHKHNGLLKDSLQYETEEPKTAQFATRYTRECTHTTWTLFYSSSLHTMQSTPTRRSTAGWTSGIV